MKENILGNNLKKMRLKTNMTQGEVAEKINKAEITYSRYERGTLKPDIDTLIMLADLYQTSLDYLTGRITTIDKLLQLIPGVSIGEEAANTMLRKRATKRNKKAKEQ